MSSANLPLSSKLSDVTPLTCVILLERPTAISASGRSRRPPACRSESNRCVCTLSSCPPHGMGMCTAKKPTCHKGIINTLPIRPTSRLIRRLGVRLGSWWTGRNGTRRSAGRGGTGRDGTGWNGTGQTFFYPPAPRSRGHEAVGYEVTVTGQLIDRRWLLFAK